MHAHARTYVRTYVCIYTHTYIYTHMFDRFPLVSYHNTHIPVIAIAIVDYDV